MNNIGELERATQKRVVQFFELVLKYDYLGDWSERLSNSNVESIYLIPFLKQQGYSDTLIQKAVDKLQTETTNLLGQSLYDANKAVYSY